MRFSKISDNKKNAYSNLNRKDKTNFLYEQNSKKQST